MKRKAIIALLLAASVLVSCGKVPEETEEGTEEETTTTVEETTEETTTTPTHRPTAMSTPSPSISSGPSDYIYITSNGEPYEEYLVTDFSFSEDGSSGTFTVERYISMTPDEVASLSEGDIILQDYKVISVDPPTDIGVSITIESIEGYVDYWYLNLQENGLYYLANGWDYYFTESATVSTTFDIASDVIIIDHCYPYNSDGIMAFEAYAVFYTISEFIDRLDDEDVYFIPNLHIRVVNGEITVIAVNPYTNSDIWCPY